KSKIRVDGVNAGQIGSVFHYTWKNGSSDTALARLDGSGALVLSDYAKKHHLKIGSPLTLKSQAGRKLAVHVVGITDAKTNGLYLAEVTVSNATFGKYFHADGDRFALIKGGSLPALKSALAAYPAAKVSTTGKFIKDQVSW